MKVFLKEFPIKKFAIFAVGLYFILVLLIGCTVSLLTLVDGGDFLGALLWCLKFFSIIYPMAILATFGVYFLDWWINHRR